MKMECWSYVVSVLLFWVQGSSTKSLGSGCGEEELNAAGNARLAIKELDTLRKSITTKYGSVETQGLELICVKDNPSDWRKDLDNKEERFCQYVSCLEEYIRDRKEQDPTRALEQMNLFKESLRKMAGLTGSRACFTASLPTLEWERFRHTLALLDSLSRDLRVFEEEVC